MSSVQWKQLARNIGDGGAFTGSLSVSGSLQTSGSLNVDGNTILRSTQSGSYSLSVEGQMKIVQQEVDAVIQKARLEIENLGTLGDTDDDNIIDLGGFF